MLIDTVKDRDTSEIKQDEFGLEPYFSDIYNYLKAVEVDTTFRIYNNLLININCSSVNLNLPF